MKINLLWIGKTDSREIQSLLEYYLKRLPSFWNISITEISDVKNAKNKSPEQIMAEECALVNQKLSPKTFLVLLDEKGKEFCSEAFAKDLDAKMTRGISDLTFAIGGAYGHHPELKKRADALLSLSKMTFTHQMARLFLVEQLYRADQILQGKPYHNP